jgi:hypothetical protein
MKARDRQSFVMGFRLALALAEDGQPAAVIREVHNALYVGWSIDEVKLMPELARVTNELQPLIDGIIQEHASGTSERQPT